MRERWIKSLMSHGMEENRAESCLRQGSGWNAVSQAMEQLEDAVTARVIGACADRGLRWPSCFLACDVVREAAQLVNQQPVSPEAQRALDSLKPFAWEFPRGRFSNKGKRRRSRTVTQEPPRNLLGIPEPARQPAPGSSPAAAAGGPSQLRAQGPTPGPKSTTGYRTRSVTKRRSQALQSTQRPLKTTQTKKSKESQGLESKESSATQVSGKGPKPTKSSKTKAKTSPPETVSTPLETKPSAPPGSKSTAPEAKSTGGRQKREKSVAMASTSKPPRHLQRGTGTGETPTPGPSQGSGVDLSLPTEQILTNLCLMPTTSADAEMGQAFMTGDRATRSRILDQIVDEDDDDSSSQKN